MIDATHDPALRSWVGSANAPETDFPIQNLPFGRVRPAAEAGAAPAAWRIGVAIGDQVLDLHRAASAIAWPADLQAALVPLATGDLNAFLALGPAVRGSMRLALSRALAEGSSQADALRACLLPQSQTEMALPVDIRDYTDFYTGIHHATTVGTLFRPDNPLLPNYKWVPIGYHGRASSIVVSGHPVRRPRGQVRPDPEQPPVHQPSNRLDYELELGAVIGTGNALGEPLDMAEAEQALAGLVLLNDWSARDMQAWEYQPLGPFLAKNFASTVSPWLVTMEALAPFRVPVVRPAGDPQPLGYLDSTANREHGAIDLTLEVWLDSAAMRARGEPPQRLSQSNFRDAYWTLAQMVTHHASNGCNLGTGDLLGTGTQSGPQPGQGGSLLELSQGGRRPIVIGGEERTFLRDGDRVILRAHTQAPGWRRIGFGDCAGTIVPAP